MTPHHIAAYLSHLALLDALYLVLLGMSTSVVVSRLSYLLLCDISYFLGIFYLVSYFVV